MINTLSAVFAGELLKDDEDTNQFVPIGTFEIVMTVVESRNPYLNGKRVHTPMQATRPIAEMMFQNTITSYEEMAGGHPFQKLDAWKYKGRFNGEKVTLELIEAK